MEFQRLFELKNINTFIILGILIIMPIQNLRSNIKYIKFLDNKNYNYLFELLERDKEYANKNVYIYIDQEDNDWEQKDLVSVELAGDMRCINGGYYAWQDDETAYLIVLSPIVEELQDSYNIVASTERYTLINHK